ncbi:MAG: alpha/beta hydrolase [Chloroflexi bacterium]|nr:alpha/beta hydrolase [Chloroflexota bacterium]MCY4248151.1 alpha/beta hydrolase [Chloroflexota bacterium]
MPTIKTARGEIWFADHRRRRPALPALLIHGAGGSHLSFPKELRRHAAWDAIAPDLPGHGKSAGAGHSQIADYALDMLALLDALEIECALLAGHSMGGAIAQWLALEHGNRARGLTLIGTGARLPVNPALIHAIVAQPAETRARLLRWMWSPGAPTEMVAASAAILEKTTPSVIQQDLLACDRFDIRARLGDIHAPALVIAGEADNMTAPALSEELVANLENAKLVTLAGGSHMAHLEAPFATAAAIGDWLAG